MLFRRIASKIKKALNNQESIASFLSYSQCGEDKIIQHLFKQLGVLKPSYIDIGANHPTVLSNTQLFYSNGCRGINIEPDPTLIKDFHLKRSEDINLNIGIGVIDESVADFFIMSNNVLNTFSKEEAERIQDYGTFKIESVIQVKIIPLQNIVDTYFPLSEGPDLISLDIEGLDYDVLSSIDLSKYERTIFCVETINYTENNTETKNDQIIDYFINNGFLIYADTYINTIFVNKKYWDNRKAY